MGLRNEAVSDKKQKKFIKTNLILALLLVVASLAVYWFEFRNTTVENISEFLIPVTQEKLPQSLKIHNGDKNIEMSCKENCKLGDPNAKWEITSPIHFTGEAGNIGALISTIKAARSTETLLFKDSNLESRLSDFGLSNEKRKTYAEIQFQGDASPYKVYFGETTAIGEDRYVLLEGPGIKTDRLYIITGHVYRSLVQDLNHWRNKRLFTFAASEVEAIHLVNEGNAIDLEKKGPEWLFKKPQLKDNRLDDDAIDSTITGLVFLNAQGYVSDDLKKDAATFKITGSPKYSVQLKLQNKSTVQVDVFETLEKKNKDSNVSPKIYAVIKDKNFIAELNSSDLNKFNKDVAFFRYKHLLSQAEKNQAAKFELILKDKTKIIFERNGLKEGDGADSTEWKLTEGKIENFDPQRMQAAIDKLATFRVTEFVKSNTLPAGATLEAQWNFYDAGGKKFVEIESYLPKTGTKRYFKLANKEIALAEKEGDFPSAIQYFQAKK